MHLPSIFRSLYRQGVLWGARAGALAMGVFFFAPAQARAQEALSLNDYTAKGGITLPEFSAEDDIQVTADRMTADRETNQSLLDGNVKVTFSDITMTCDRATYDVETGDIHAEGDVRIVTESGDTWTGDALDFNHKTGEGLLGASTLKAGAFTVKADSTARDDDGVLHARRTTVTTCANPEEHWHWSVTGTGRYKDREFLELRDGTGTLFGLPLLWMPYYYRDLNTNYGWRFMPGYTGKWGAYLKMGYVYPIAGSSEQGNYLYGKNVLELRSKFGVGVGQELTWGTRGGIFGEDTRQWGRLTLYYAYHRDDQDAEDANWQSSYDDHRWSIGFRENIEFGPRDSLKIRAEKVSDSQFRQDYDELSVRAAAQPLGIANYEHRENAWVTSLAVAGPLDSFYAGTRRLPELRLEILPQPFLGIDKLYYESQNAIGWLRRQPAKYNGVHDTQYMWRPGNWAYYDTLRIDTRHILRRPFTLTDGVTFTPRVGWRGTYYADSPDGDSTFRSLFEIGATLQARYWRDYETMRHTVIPYLDFTWVPGSQAKATDQPYVFDGRDQEFEWRDRYRSDGLTPSHRYTGIRFGLRNILQELSEEGASNRIFNADLYGVYVLQTQDHWVRWTHRDQPGRNNFTDPAFRFKEETGLRVLGANLSYAPSKTIELYTDFQYDPEENRLALWDINARFEVDPLTLYIGYLTRDHEVYDYYWADRVDDALVYGGFIHHFSDTVDWSLYARYNTDRNDLEEVGGFFQYSLDCISFRFNLGYLPSYTTEDDYKHDSDIRLSIGAWLRAFPKEEDEDWMDWGNLTNRRLLEGE